MAAELATPDSDPQGEGLASLAKLVRMLRRYVEKRLNKSNSGPSTSTGGPGTGGAPAAPGQQMVLVAMSPRDLQKLKLLGSPTVAVLLEATITPELLRSATLLDRLSEHASMRLPQIPPGLDVETAPMETLVQSLLETGLDAASMLEGSSGGGRRFEILDRVDGREQAVGTAPAPAQSVEEAAEMARGLATQNPGRVIRLADDSGPIADYIDIGGRTGRPLVQVRDPKTGQRAFAGSQRDQALIAASKQRMLPPQQRQARSTPGE